MKERIIAIALVIAMLMALASCKKDNKNDTPDDGLDVEIEALEYTEDDISAASAEVKELAAELARVLGYANQVHDEDVEELGEKFKNDVVPALVDVRIYPSELTSLLGCIRECIELADENVNEGITPKIISDMYSKCVSVIDTERFGALVYELDLLILAGMADEAQKKYDSLGYPFYLDDVKYYNSVIDDARKLGRSDFSKALSALVFTASAFNGSASFKGDGVNISVADSVAIMKKQAKEFASLELNGDDWKIVAEMCDVFISWGVADGLKGRVTLALDSEEFFVESMVVMPELIAFYAKVMSGVSDESIALIESGDKYAYERAICSEILKNEGELKTLLTALEAKIPDASEKCLALMEDYDRSGYNSFLQKYSFGVSELVAAMRSFTSEPTKANYDSLIKKAIGCAARINPVVTYVYVFK